MSAGPTLSDRCLVGVEIESYSRRNTRQQRDAQRDLRALMAGAAQAAGLDPSAWEVFLTGDGEHAVLPAGVDLLAVVGRFVPVLHDLLVLRNEDRAPGAKIRLRIAVHTGALTSGVDGAYAGMALVVLSQLLDSAPVRQASARADRSDLALILSASVHEKVVLSGLLALGESNFARVDVGPPDEGARQAAYVQVPGHDMRTFALGALGAGDSGLLHGSEGTGTDMATEATAADRSRPSAVQAGPGAIVVSGDFVVGGNVDTSITTQLDTGTSGEAPR